MEDLVVAETFRFPERSFWSGRNVLVTGHTGFKGTWLSFWLTRLGANVSGLSLAPINTPNLHDEIGLSALLTHSFYLDIRDFDAVQAAVRATQPDVVFHLAAQSLVLPSYADPLTTFSTNVMGTANVIEAARQSGSVRATVIVTTDKCYENLESTHRYREDDRLGGHDPYSSSKACAELVASCWRKSFDSSTHRIATARAGNVIGAGDWSVNRLLPDCFRAFAADQPVSLRHPQAIRPWQHVLEPLNGYLLLAESLCSENGSDFASAWNFGPYETSEACVGDVAQMAATAWGPSATVECADTLEALHEAGQLRLDSERAHKALHWAPQWALAKAVLATTEGYLAHKKQESLLDLLSRQIDEYVTGK